MSESNKPAFAIAFVLVPQLQIESILLNLVLMLWFRFQLSAVIPNYFLLNNCILKFVQTTLEHKFLELL